MYDKFIKILIDGDLRLLVIDGEPALILLAEAWQSILQEYVDCIKTPKSKSILEAWKKVIKTDYQIYFISCCLAYLREVGYDEQIALKIAELGYDFITDGDDLEKQIFMVETEAKTLQVLLNQYNIEYRLLSPASESPIKRDMVDYQKDLSVLTKYLGVRIRASEITVMEYCSYFNDYMDYNTQIMRENYGRSTV